MIPSPLRPRFFLAALAIAFFLSPFSTHPVLAQNVEAALTPMKVAGKCYDWIIDESTGRVFAAIAHDYKGAVVEFDPLTGEELRRFKPLPEH